MAQTIEFQRTKKTWVLRWRRVIAPQTRFVAQPRFGAPQRFGKPRQSGTSHSIFKTPWPGDPRVNIQNAKGMAKAYPVRQVLQAIDKLDSKP